MTTDTVTYSGGLPPKRKPAVKPSPNESKPSLSDADRYKIAYTQVWANLPRWKQLAIDDDKKNGVGESRFTTAFVEEVTRIAENMEN